MGHPFQDLSSCKTLQHVVPLRSKKFLHIIIGPEYLIALHSPEKKYPPIYHLVKGLVKRSCFDPIQYSMSRDPIG
jgi:hypothetical protein